MGRFVQLYSSMLGLQSLPVLHVCPIALILPVSGDLCVAPKNWTPRKGYLYPPFIPLESFVISISITSTIPSLSNPPSLSNEELPSFLLSAKAFSAFMRVSKLKYFIFYAWSAFEVCFHHSRLHSCRRIVVFTSVPLAIELPARSAIYQGRHYGKSHFALVQRPSCDLLWRRSSLLHECTPAASWTWNESLLVDQSSESPSKTET